MNFDQIPDWVKLVLVFVGILFVHTLAFQDECMTDAECRCVEDCLEERRP